MVLRVHPPLGALDPQNLKLARWHLAGYVHEKEQHQHKINDTQEEHNNYVDTHLNSIQDEVAELRGSVHALKEPDAKRRRMDAPGRCACEHTPVAKKTWLDIGAEVFVETGSGVACRYVRGWSSHGYKLSFDSSGHRLCKRCVRTPLVLKKKCAVCNLADA